MLEEEGNDTLVRFDPDGEGEAESAALLLLKNVSPSDLSADNFAPNFSPDGSEAKGLTIDGTYKSDDILGTVGDDLISGADGHVLWLAKLVRMRFMEAMEMTRSREALVTIRCGEGGRHN